MRRHYSTEQYAVYKQEAAEEFWGQVRWRTQQALQRMLEADSEQQMADYLGLAPYERSEEPDERVDSRRLLRARLCDGCGLDSHPGAADAQAFLPAARDR
jgi:hypothetical protein